MSVGFLPLSINIGCTHHSEPVHSAALYPTSQAGFSQAIKSGNLLFTSGMVAWDVKRTPLPTSFQQQLDAIFINLEHLAMEGSSSLSQAIFLRFYVVDLDADKRNIISQKLQDLFPHAYKPASSLVGVSALATEELMLEIELISEINNPRPQ